MLDKRSYFSALLFSVFFLLACPVICPAEQDMKEPVTVNGDNVEYSTDSKEVTASGNVSIIYKDTKLTCEHIKINTETKDAEATGNVRLEDKKGVIEGEKIKYNFQNKTGVITDASFRSSPYFGRAESMDKISDSEFIGHRSYVTTCSYDHPHYRLKSKKVDFFPGDKVAIKDVVFSFGQDKQIPVMYFPGFEQSFKKDRLTHTQFTGGKSKDWGYYLLTATKYHITDNIRGRIYLDYRNYLGVAEGFITNYDTKAAGTGDFKFYYTQERDKSGRLGKDVNAPKVFQRYLVRWRHKWDIGPRTNFVSQYYKIIDSRRALYGASNSFLKDYFPREFDKDTQPPSYAQLHHSFNYSGIDVVFQKRINRWYDSPQLDAHLEKLPQISYSMPSIRVGETPFFFETGSSFSNFAYKYTVPSSNDFTMVRVDTLNKFSMPVKVAFLYFTPFVASRQTYYNEDINGAAIAPRTIFYTGADLSTKFYRIFDVNSNFLGIELNGLRHIITPTVSYTYNRQPTIKSSRLKQIDAVDAIGYNNSVAIGLQNKLQTKRKNKTIDLLDFRIDTGYMLYGIDTATNSKLHGQLSDFTLNLDFFPNSFMKLHADSIYTTKEKFFKQVNADVNFSFSTDTYLSLGHRYERKGSKEMTFTAGLRLNPKWKIAFYDRYQFGNTTTIKGGLREQRVTITRDLHCWETELTLDDEKGKGTTIWWVFRLKAFPELEFDFNKSYNAPKPGSQSNNI
ncbi:MAG: LPS assembly protein LptD [Candidatus Omnitrophota bacterium]